MRPKLVLRYTPFVAVAVACLCPARAQTLYFDVNGNGANQSSQGSGIQAGSVYSWDRTSSYWTALATGGESGGPGSPQAVKTWIQNAAAVFSAGTNGGVAFTVNVTTNINASSIQIEEGTPTFSVSSGSALSVGAISADVAGSPLNIGGTGSASISGIISGRIGALNKSGAGTLTVSGSNAYTGTTTVQGGTLRATTNANALGTGALALSGGSLALANDAPLAFNRPTTISASATITSDRLTAGAGVTHTLGALSIGGQTLSLAKGSNVTSGTAGLTFGATTLTGATTFSAAASTLLTLDSITGTNQNFVVRGAGTTTISGSVNVGTGTLTKSDTGTLNLSGPANSFTGKLNASAGTVAITNSQAVSSIANTGSGTINFGTGSTLTIANASNHTYGGTLAGLGGMTLDSSGATLTLSGGSSTYSGPTTITAGTLRIVTQDAMPSATSSFVLNGGTLSIAGSGTFQSAGTLMVSAASTINFTPSVIQTLVLGDSSGASWSGPVTLNNYSTSTHQIRFGDGSSSGLTSQQLSLLSLSGYSGSSLSINAQGYLEVGSAVPEPSTYAALFGAAALVAAAYHRRRRRLGAAARTSLAAA